MAIFHCYVSSPEGNHDFTKGSQEMILCRYPAEWKAHWALSGVECQLRSMVTQGHLCQVNHGKPSNKLLIGSSLLLGLPHFNAYIDWCYVMQCPVLFDSSKNKGFWSARLENQSCMKSLSISPPLIAALFRWAVFKTPVGWWSWWFLGIILGIIIQSGNVKNVFTVQVPWAAGDTATFAPAGGPPARSRPSHPSCACGGRAAPALRAASVPRAAHAGAALGSLTGTGGTDAQWPGAVEVYGDFRGKSMEFSWDIYGYLWDFHGFSGIFVGQLWDFLGFSWKTYEIFWHSKFVKWGFRKIFESVPLDFSFLLVSHHFPRYFLLIFPCFSGFWTWTFTRRSWLAMAAIVLPQSPLPGLARKPWFSLGMRM